MNEIQRWKKKIHKTVAYHTGALGDLLISTAALYEAIQLFPHTEVTLVGSGLWKEILVPSQWPRIYFIVEVQHKKWKNLTLWQANFEKNTWEETAFPFPSFVHFLKQFQTSIDLRSESLRFALQAFLAKIPCRVGASRNYFSKFFFTHFTLEKYDPNVHERDRYLNILLSVNAEYIQERKKFWQENGLPALKKSVPREIQNIILINPTASIREKAWQSHSFRQLALLLKERGYDVHVIGAPKETPWLGEVAGDDFKILQPQSISQLIDLVRAARLLITNTSSMQFIAAGTQTYVITLMGTAKPAVWGPVGKLCSHLQNLNFERVKPSFFSYGKKDCDRINETRAYQNISVDFVFEHVLKILTVQET